MKKGNAYPPRRLSETKPFCKHWVVFEMRTVVSPMSNQMKRKLSELVDPMTQFKGELKVIKKQLKVAEQAAERDKQDFLRKCNTEHAAFEADLRREIRRRETTGSKKKLRATLKGVVDKGLRKTKRELHYENLWYASLQHDDVIKAKAHDFHKKFTAREKQGWKKIHARHTGELNDLQDREKEKEDEIWSMLGSDEDVTDDDGESEDDVGNNVI